MSKSPPTTSDSAKSSSTKSNANAPEDKLLTINNITTRQNPLDKDLRRVVFSICNKPYITKV